MSNKITNIYAREILDSRGDPTIEATVEVDKIIAKAKVPSGASTGKYEALELRDNDQERYNGKGVLKAIQNVNGEINNDLKGKDILDLKNLDQRLIDLDGTANKSRLGANAILSVSLALARAGALVNNLPLYKFIQQYYKFDDHFTMPVPLANLVNGGLHADSSLDFQEFWVIPQGIDSFKERARAVSEIFHHLGKILTSKKYDTDLGNEGGYAPNVKSSEEVWEMMLEAVKRAGYQAGQQIFLGMDAGTSTLFDPETGKYVFKRENKNLSPEELTLLYEGWLAKYPFMAFEDPFGEDEWASWISFNQKLSGINKKILLIGDDLLATNIGRLREAMEKQAINSVLIKPNQIGTLTETINCVKLAQTNNLKIAVSHRSGETEDDFIADLAVAVKAEYVKIGSTARSERIAKYNRLMEIEQELNLV